MDTWLAEHLICPRDQSGLRRSHDLLVCDLQHTYRIVADIPVLLTDDLPPTLPAAWERIDDVIDQPESESTIAVSATAVDPWVQEMVAATNGQLYKPLIGRLKRLPIPELRLPFTNGERLLDLGCNWGRWTVSAARKGYQPVGLDPNLSAALAAQRIADQLGVHCAFVVADARLLPFADGAFDHVFSYSVIQHFSKPDARLAIRQIARALRPDGQCKIQMANKFGVRSLQQQFRLRSRPVSVFAVRYWSPRELLRSFNALVGPSRLTVDGYFGLGIQPADIDILPMQYQLVVRASERLRTLSTHRCGTWLLNVADSLYVDSIRSDHLLAP